MSRRGRRSRRTTATRLVAAGWERGRAEAVAAALDQVVAGMSVLDRHVPDWSRVPLQPAPPGCAWCSGDDDLDRWSDEEDDEPHDGAAT